MPGALTHEQCRRQMCAACGGLAGKDKVTRALGDRIRKWAQPSWNEDVVSHPVGICKACRQSLYLCDKQKSTHLTDRPGVTGRWQAFKLEEVVVPRGQLASSCCCPICRARKSNPVANKGFNGAITEKNRYFQMVKM